MRGIEKNKTIPRQIERERACNWSSLLPSSHAFRRPPTFPSPSRHLLLSLLSPFITYSHRSPLLLLPNFFCSLLLFYRMSEVVADTWRRYLLQLQLHPLRTKAITAGVLAGCSDAIAQKISGIKRLQLRRLLLIMLYGFAYGGPFGHFLHKLMDTIFKGKKGNKTVAQKVLLEQLTTSPWNNMFFMMYYGLVIEGRPFSLVKNKVRKDYPSIQLTAWKFWPIVGWVNYQYMPLQFRVLFHSFVASCWAIFLNLKARSVAVKKA